MLVKFLNQWKSGRQDQFREFVFDKIYQRSTQTWPNEIGQPCDEVRS